MRNSDQETYEQLHNAFHKVMDIMELDLEHAVDAYFVLSCCRIAIRDVFELTQEATEAAERAAAMIGKEVADMAQADIAKQKKAREKPI